MKPCINARFCPRKNRCDPEACGDYVPALASAALILMIFLASLACCLVADAVTLSISGHSSGDGQQNLSFSGDRINVSLSKNGTGWNITAEGGA